MKELLNSLNFGQSFDLDYLLDLENNEVSRHYNYVMARRRNKIIRLKAKKQQEEEENEKEN